MSICIFTGPSLTPQQALQLLPQAQVRPPVARGDLRAARSEGAELILIIDGTFSHQLAVSPREVVDVLADGATVLGASSMGAIRAAECWPAGMRGVGAVYRLYRANLLTSDDPVAVATDPDSDFAAVSVALVNVYAAARRARRRGLIDRSAATAIEAAASGMFFAHRNWRSILRVAGVSDPDGSIRAFCEGVDIKHIDAVRAVRELARTAGSPPAGMALPAVTRGEVRYPGHDPLLGRASHEVEEELVRWLFGSGRYQRYVWPLVVGEPEFTDLDQDEDRPAALRDRLAMVLARMLGQPSTLGSRLIAELEFTDELHSELMRWHAVARVSAAKADQGVAVRSNLLTATRESVAITHGYGEWRALASDVVDGRLFGAIPLSWVEQACARLALAKS